MPKNKKASTLISSIGHLFTKNLRLIVYAVVLTVVIWLGNFIYQNVVITVILDRDIDETEIIARKQKVNVELFETTTAKTLEKKDVSAAELLGSTNPFE